jgi:hypothetical protein
MTVPDVPVEDARDRVLTVLRYDTSHIQICRSAAGFRAPTLHITSGDRRRQPKSV